MPRGYTPTLKPFSGKWKSGATKTIRVPIALANSVLDYAIKLDSGEIHLSQVNEPSFIESEVGLLHTTDHIKLDENEMNHLLQVIRTLEEIYQVPRNSFGKAAKEKLLGAIDELKSLVTSE